MVTTTRTPEWQVLMTKNNWDSCNNNNSWNKVSCCKTFNNSKPCPKKWCTLPLTNNRCMIRCSSTTPSFTRNMITSNQQPGLSEMKPTLCLGWADNQHRARILCHQMVANWTMTIIETERVLLCSNSKTTWWTSRCKWRWWLLSSRSTSSLQITSWTRLLPNRATCSTTNSKRAQCLWWKALWFLWCKVQISWCKAQMPWWKVQIWSLKALI